MGFWDSVKGAIRKVGNFISSGAKKVWDVIKNPRKIGGVIKDIGKFVKPVLPFIGMLGPQGKAISAIGGAGLDVAEKLTS